MLAPLKSSVKRLVGERTIGKLEYWMNPTLTQHWEGPLNGQIQRQRIFSELRQQLPLRALVETGTFRGTTTQWFADSGVPIYTVEANPRFHAFAELRLRPLRERVHLYLGDSRSFLKQLASSPRVPDSHVFFYLDAHWHDDLPLREEVEIIFSKWRQSVVMVDDFHVPGAAYAYDDYGPGKALNLDYLAPLATLRLMAYFPRADAAEETGARRGCVILCNEPGVAEILNGLSTLKGPTPVR